MSFRIPGRRLGPFLAGLAVMAMPVATQAATIPSQATSQSPQPSSAALQTATSQSSPTFASALVYQIGDQGPGVRQIQSLLNTHGFSLTVDGDFGPLTKNAVMAFQAAQHITVDGVVGPQTMSRLDTPATSSSVSLPVEASYGGMLREGSLGPAVAAVQQRLAQLGFYHAGIDGDFGPLTLAAVLNFQRAHGLAVDGIVGPATEQALGNAGVAVNRGSVSPQGSAVAGYALHFVGYRYVYGGASPSTGFDCSGLVQYVYHAFGISLERTSYAQWTEGSPVALNQLQPGDLVFFDADGPGASHVGIYIGNGEFVAADNPAVGVRVDHLNNPYWMSHFIGGRRIV